MSSIPIILAVLGVAILAWAVRSFLFIRRSLADDDVPNSLKRWRFVSVVVGGLLALSTLWHAYPLNGGKAAGIPFMAVWLDAQGRDYIGPFTLPAVLGNFLFWFLVPQIVLAFLIRKRAISSNKASYAACGSP